MRERQIILAARLEKMWTLRKEVPDNFHQPMFLQTKDSEEELALVDGAQTVKAPKSTKPLTQGCLNGVTNISKKKKTVNFVSRGPPYISLCDTRGKQMHVGFLVGGRTAGFAYPEVHGRVTHFASVM